MHIHILPPYLGICLFNLGISILDKNTAWWFLFNQKYPRWWVCPLRLGSGLHWRLQMWQFHYHHIRWSVNSYPSLLITSLFSGARVLLTLPSPLWTEVATALKVGGRCGSVNDLSHNGSINVLLKQVVTLTWGILCMNHQEMVLLYGRLAF